MSTATRSSAKGAVYVASGTAPLSYQWRFNGTNLSGATSSALALSNVQTNNSGSYAVVVSNISKPNRNFIVFSVNKRQFGRNRAGVSMEFCSRAGAQRFGGPALNLKVRRSVVRSRFTNLAGARGGGGAWIR